ncbi:hypothetical protein FPV16_22040 [Methylobacterium sp. W2]|uniref:hypothetical protein n=1 Tax=Methylobacterium sp. W2 TaxID=2598107 RepID=UPI001D0C17F8|nr:hypothetical protein [Methylobacterium sp. W2]MCC0808851.1 hypothetical protein [Methylobacterium sp. W2]
MPYSLAGAWILQQASCEECADTTKRFEQDVTRNLFGPFRSFHKMPTRRKDERLTHVDLLVENGNSPIRIRQPIAKCKYIPLIMPFFAEPGIQLDAPPDKTYALEPIMWQEPLPDFMKSFAYGIVLPGINISMELKFKSDNFLRLIAKIAHASSVIRFGIDAAEWMLPDYILGRKSNIRYLVGSIGQLRNFDEGTNWFAREDVILIEGVRYLTCTISLFCMKGCPVYSAIVCKSNEMIDSYIKDHNHKKYNQH